VACAGACTATPSIVRFVVGTGLGPACGVGAGGAAGAAGTGAAGNAGDSIVGAKPLAGGVGALAVGALAIGDEGRDVAGIPSIVRFGADAGAGDATGATGVSAVGSTAAMPSIVRAIGA